MGCLPRAKGIFQGGMRTLSTRFDFTEFHRPDRAPRPGSASGCSPSSRSSTLLLVNFLIYTVLGFSAAIIGGHLLKPPTTPLREGPKSRPSSPRLPTVPGRARTGRRRTPTAARSSRAAPPRHFGVDRLRPAVPPSLEPLFPHRRRSVSSSSSSSGGSPATSRTSATSRSPGSTRSSPPTRPPSVRWPRTSRPGEGARRPGLRMAVRRAPDAAGGRRAYRGGAGSCGGARDAGGQGGQGTLLGLGRRGARLVPAVSRLDAGRSPTRLDWTGPAKTWDRLQASHRGAAAAAGGSEALTMVVTAN